MFSRNYLPKHLDIMSFSGLLKPKEKTIEKAKNHQDPELNIRFNQAKAHCRWRGAVTTQ